MEFNGGAQDFEIDDMDETFNDPSLDNEYNQSLSGRQEEVYDRERDDDDEGYGQYQQGQQYQQQGQYNRNSAPFNKDQQQFVPELVKQFVSYLNKHIKERKVYDIQSMYENSFNKITEKYYKQTSWPAAESIASIVNNDPLFLILYKELTYRHVYSKMIPTLEQRFDSWRNYCELFNLLLNANPDLALDLPNQWLWDMIDEFIYQYQSFCQYRSKLKTKSQEDLTILKNNPQVWNTISVINYLQSLVNKSKIIQFLEKEKQGETEQQQGPAYINHPVYKMLGYFSIIGLLRMHCLVGDYFLALKTVAPIEMNTRGLLTKVTACHVTFFYYLGFVYMMMRRYVDAIKTFSNILLYINRIKQYHTRSSQYEQMLKKNEQMYALLSMCQALCPQRVDENVHTYLKEKYSEKTQRMQKGEEAVFEELFVYACPKFVNPAGPNYAQLLEDPYKYPANNTNQEPLKHQSKLFLAEVRQQATLPTIRSYLKLYTTIGTNKLANFLDQTNETAFRTQLLCYKHKMRGLQWSAGSPLSGEMETSSDVDFFIDRDMIHIHDAKVARKYSEFFLRHINKFDSIIRDLADNRS